MAALRSKTVANGCTPGEAAAAAAKLRELEAKHPTESEPGFRRFYRFDKALDMETLNAMMDALMRQHFGNMGRPQQPPPPPKERTFQTVRECAEHYLDPRWKRRLRDGSLRPLTNAEVAELCRAKVKGARTTAATVASIKSRMKRRA